MPVGLGPFDLADRRCALLVDGLQPQAAVFQDLQRAPLGRIEVAHQPAGAHLVELDAGQLAERLAALMPQPLGLRRRRAQGAVELALVAMQFGDRALDLGEGLPSGPHFAVTTS